ncbi:MAG TPA: Rrf2 family transcriptional regulator [Pyrinomonadaceae bacterium]|jgi:Rrf2 family protein|nr:Rrf2 family transcriptional regulator [Pyrinomonadaceae bacterium]
MSTNSRFAVAVHVLTLMAWSGEEPLKSEQVAESVNTNPVVIRRMLCELAEAGLVVSQTGSLGGSRLASDPAKTTLLDVYQALECGGVFSLHRQPPSRDCPVGVNIETVLGDVLLEVDAAVEAVLAKITISDVVQRLKPCVSKETNTTVGRIEKKNGRQRITLSQMRAGTKSRRVKALRTA